MIADSFGRPWRLGQAEVAIGCAGVVAARRLARAQPTPRAASSPRPRSRSPTSSPRAADLARTKDSGEPAVLIRGAERWWTADDGPGAAALRRPADRDLFR